MSDVRNEVQITLAGEVRVMRATFAAIRNIERDLRTNIIPLISKVGAGDMGVEQAAIVIHHGLLGYQDPRLDLDGVGEAVMAAGLPAVMEAVVKFLSTALEGVGLGKPKAVPAE